ncbi:hypothetical protein WN944_001630 [Citrus x changshan-huyou]|uniref:Uncharacterized protein n=1 Tax=Citrus x changshan-huyou TaxID=2935761 RepID=A0AAP0MK49_9ROSI
MLTDEASNSSLYEEFLDTYFISPSYYEKLGLCSGNGTKQPTADLAANDENEQHVYSLSASDDDVYNQPTEPGQNANEVELFRSDDDDVDELLSCYSSDDNEFSACSDEDGDRVMDQMDSEMRADMYIPRDDQAVEFFDTILANPETNVSFIQSELDRMYGCRVNKQKVYKAKKIAYNLVGLIMSQATSL